MTNDEIDKLLKENARMRRTLASVERYANHHGIKPQISAREALSMIQHHPCIEEITRSYVDGVIPATFNPYAELEKLKSKLATVDRSAFEKWYKENVNPEERFEIVYDKYDSNVVESVWQMWQGICKELRDASASS